MSMAKIYKHTVFQYVTGQSAVTSHTRFYYT